MVGGDLPHATLASGSWVRCASKTASLIWSQILSVRMTNIDLIYCQRKVLNQSSLVMWVKKIHWAQQLIWNTIMFCFNVYLPICLFVAVVNNFPASSRMSLRFPCVHPKNWEHLFGWCNTVIIAYFMSIHLVIMGQVKPPLTTQF